MKSTPLENKIAALAAPVANDMGLEVVCVKIIGEGGSKNVQIMAEDPKTGRLGLDHCASLSKALSAVLDVEDPIQGAYRLEVSSPGIDRPLVRAKDFETYAGFEARLETDMPHAETGQRKYKGTLNGVKDDKVLIDTEQGNFEIPFDNLTKAKLLLTEKLMQATANKETTI